MAAAITASGRFTVNILGEAEHGLARRFARPDRAQGWEAIADVGLVRRNAGPPVLPCAVAWADCHVTRTIPVGDHSCYIGAVVALDRRVEAMPLVHYRGRLRGLGPGVAPVAWLEMDEVDLVSAW